jgi:hypothetical protein
LPSWGVHLTDLGESIALQLASEPDECGPEPPMHLPVHKPADEHIRRIPHETSQRKDLMALWVTPPLSANVRASRGVRECDHWSVRRLENHPMALDKPQRGSAIHRAPMTLLTHARSRNDEIGS